MTHTHLLRSSHVTLKLALAAILLPLPAVLGTWTPAAAVDHREGPLITLDATANISDSYSVVFPGLVTTSPPGPLTLAGVPFDQPTWGRTDTLLELGADVASPLTTPVTIPVELTRLNLRTTTPLRVFFQGGSVEQWNIELGVSPGVPSTGTLDLSPTGPLGGTVAIELPLAIIATFTREGDGVVRTFDYGQQTGGAVRLGGSGSFSLQCPLNRLAIPGVTTPFCLGHNLTTGGVLPVTLIDLDNPSNPRLVSRVEPTPAPVNNPPTLAPIGNMTMTTGNQLSRTLAASDPDGNALTFNASGLPAFCALTDRGNGTALLNCAPAAGDAGSYTIGFGVTDNGSPPLSDSETVTLTVQQGNRPPVLNPIGLLEAREGESRTFIFSATDPDGDMMTFSMQNAPGYSQFVDNGNGTATFTVSPPAGSEFDTFEITVTVTDTGAPPLSDQETFTLNITPGSGNLPPVLDPIGDQTVREGELTRLTSLIRATDENRDTLSVSAVGLPTPCFLVPNTAVPGVVVEDLQCDADVQAGLYTVTVTVTDGFGGSDSETFALTVLPFLDAGGDQTVVQGTPVELTATSPNPNLTYSWDVNNDGIFDNAIGAIVSFPTAGLTPGTYPVTVQGCAPDSGAGSVCNTDTVDVTVRNAWTYDDLRRLTREYVDNPIVERGLVALVNLAEAFAGGGLHVFANGTLDLYIRTIQAATPRFVTAVETQELLEIAGALKR